MLHTVVAHVTVVVIHFYSTASRPCTAAYNSETGGGGCSRVRGEETREALWDAANCRLIRASTFVTGMASR